MKKGKKKEEEFDLPVLLTDLYLLRQERKEIENREKKLSDAIIKLTAPDDAYHITIDDDLIQARHETAETPVINPDINWVRKKVGSIFDKIIKVSVTDARKEGGQALINLIKIGQNTSHSIKFYKVKEDEE